MAILQTPKRTDSMAQPGNNSSYADDAGTGAASTDIIRNAVPSMDTYGFAYGGRRKAELAAAIIIIAVVIVVIYIAMQRNGTMPAGTITTAASQNSTTTTANASVQMVSGINATGPELNHFLAVYNLSFGTNATQVYQYYNPNCKYTGYSKLFANNVPVSNATVDYYSLNQSALFDVFIVIKIINASNMSAYMNQYDANKGFCNRLTGELAENSKFNSYAQSYVGINGYLLQFSELNQTALNISQTYYTGQFPNISVVESSVIYRNADISVQAWGFGSHVNKSFVIEDTNSLLGAFMSRFH